MRSTYILLLAAFFLVSSCSKKDEVNKCLNGGKEKDGTCICADGYMGDLCETAINVYFTGEYTGDYYLLGSKVQGGTIVIEPSPNGNARLISLYQKRNQHWKEYMYDAAASDMEHFDNLIHTDTTTVKLSGRVTDNHLHLDITQTDKRDNSVVNLSFEGDRN